MFVPPMSTARTRDPCGAGSSGDDPALVRIYADKDSPRVNGEGWHSDVSCDEEPPMGSILQIKQCPPNGGDTLFANMYAAYESLSERMKSYLGGLTALHDGELPGHHPTDRAIRAIDILLRGLPEMR